MALVKCKECGREVSTKAAACPHCGATRRRTSAVTKLVAGILGLGTVLGIVGAYHGSRQDEAKAAAESARVAALSPEQRQSELTTKQKAAARDAATKKSGDEMFAKAQILASAIRRSANDPSSIEISSAGYTDSGAVYLEYRGKNAFNATIRNTAILTPKGKIVVGSDSDVAATWNAEIAKRPLHLLPSP